MPVKRRVAVTPAQDEHTLEAISHAYKDGMVEPVLIGDEAAIREILNKLGVSAEGMTIIHVPDPTEAIQKAADMARDGEVDCIMKGKTETGALMKVLVNRERGIRKNDTMSLLAFMESPNYHKVFAITDVGLLTYPTKEQKKAAIANAVEAFPCPGRGGAKGSHSGGCREGESENEGDRGSSRDQGRGCSWMYHRGTNQL